MAEAREVTSRALRLEVVLVLVITFGLSAVTSVLQLVDAVLRTLSAQKVPLIPRRSYFDLVDFGLNLASIAQLIAWGGLGLYLLWRSGIRPRDIGLSRPRWRPDALGGLGLAAVIGIPGLGLYVLARIAGLSASVVPTTLTDTWWRIPVLVLAAFANGWAEEVIVVGYLMTRLQQLGVGSTRTVLYASLLRGAYHLYQGLGAGLGNFAMGVVFGFVWRRYGRLWPLIVAHAMIDTVAFVGYALLAGHLGWLP
ncbi:MAG: CPBP family intramembrane glutamic endopeptidase [Candidatus Sericytochromatia bacterium]